jgi:hypothetical protein
MVERCAQPETKPVLVQLTNAWHETITREEGVRRLARQERSRGRRSEIETSISPRTEHFLTFDERVFREYVQLGDGPAVLLLMLGARSAGDAFHVSLPKPNGVRRWKRHEFRDVAGVLHENGSPRTTFRRLEQPLELAVDVSFVRPDLPMQCPCRGATGRTRLSTSTRSTGFAALEPVAVAPGSRRAYRAESSSRSRSAGSRRTRPSPVSRFRRSSARGSLSGTSRPCWISASSTPPSRPPYVV